MRRILFLVMPAVLAILSGCQQQPREAESTGQPAIQGQDPQVDQDPKQRALAARDALFRALSARLMQAMAQGGPAGAIEVCSKEARRLAEQVSREHGVRIGRTSFKLRNPKNVPPDWAKEMVERRVQEPRFLTLPDGRIAALLPIRLQAQCLACHGPSEQIRSEVKEQLARFYPEDQATGFQEGDLRGWFWVEVPGASEEQEGGSAG